MVDLYVYIAENSGSTRAKSFTDAIVANCLSLDLFPERGIAREELRPGLRATTFRRRVTIAYHIADKTVTIDRILYGGRDLPRHL